MIFILLCLTYFTQWWFLSPSMMLSMTLNHSFLCLSNIELYIHTPSSYPFLCWYTFGYFQVQAMVNSAAMNIWIHVSFWIMMFFDIWLGVGFLNYMFSSVQFSHSVVSNSLHPHEQQHTRPPCPSPTPRVHSNPCPLSRWCHPTNSSSVVPFSSCLQSFPASGSFQMSQLSASGGQSIGVSDSTSVPPMNTQDWSPSEWTGWISLQYKGLSRVFSNTTVRKHQFFDAQLFL